MQHRRQPPSSTLRGRLAEARGASPAVETRSNAGRSGRALQDAWRRRRSARESTASPMTEASVERTLAHGPRSLTVRLDTVRDGATHWSVDHAQIEGICGDPGDLGDPRQRALEESASTTNERARPQVGGPRLNGPNCGHPDRMLTRIEHHGAHASRRRRDGLLTETSSSDAMPSVHVAG